MFTLQIMLFKNNAKKYGAFEEGNQLSFQQFEKYVKENLDEDFSMGHILEQMSEIVKMTFKSIEHLFEVTYKRDYFIETA